MVASQDVTWVTETSEDVRGLTIGVRSIAIACRRKVAVNATALSPHWSGSPTMNAPEVSQAVAGVAESSGLLICFFT